MFSVHIDSRYAVHIQGSLYTYTLGMLSHYIQGALYTCTSVMMSTYIQGALYI